MREEFGYSDANADDKSESSLDFVGKRLGMLISRLGMDKSVRITDKSAKQLKRYCEGAEPPFTVLKNISEASGASLEWITYGDSHSKTDIELDITALEKRLSEIEKELSRRPRPPEDARKQLHKEADLLHEAVAAQRHRLKLLAELGRDRVSSVRNERRITTGNQSTVDIDEADLINVPRYNVFASAGDGILPVDETEGMDSVILSRVFIKRLGGNPDACHIIFARGDSMLPTIPDGSLLLIDRSKYSIKDNAVFAFRVGEMIRVKRVRLRLDHGIDLVSDNQIAGYPPETYSQQEIENITPLGKIICVMHCP